MVSDFLFDFFKFLEDVQQFMQNIVYWVSNSRYSSQLDDSAIFIKDKLDISERELCKEIIGIYFSEMDSDSFFFFFCLENFLDGEDFIFFLFSLWDLMCFLCILEINLDDFFMVVYIFVKVLEVYIRKISSGKLYCNENLKYCNV